MRRPSRALSCDPALTTTTRAAVTNALAPIRIKSREWYAGGALAQVSGHRRTPAQSRAQSPCESGRKRSSGAFELGVARFRDAARSPSFRGRCPQPRARRRGRGGGSEQDAALFPDAIRQDAHHSSPARSNNPARCAHRAGRRPDPVGARCGSTAGFSKRYAARRDQRCRNSCDRRLPRRQPRRAANHPAATRHRRGDIHAHEFADNHKRALQAGREAMGRLRPRRASDS